MAVQSHGKFSLDTGGVDDELRQVRASLDPAQRELLEEFTTNQGVDVSAFIAALCEQLPANDQLKPIDLAEAVRRGRIIAAQRKRRGRR
jgi:hypothetical protein